ncbi:Ran GTPase-activating protein (RanGAP) involved in mRNA processing and transport [Legionella beliardensis]|uniref:Ran GTPase-activating protein (RanGAP) involved in mRNA processing and transport n=1 Tax=Legionella beliardensis TaxID=91822 RepID=A0A378HZ37_9GAMM|nr:hypothetical protein [Legionella beliardensis]STX28003.1 Ran GTPase-activating protein (RanGAP) involved in mRNA processing and transport [Legionella beliardensis]
MEPEKFSSLIKSINSGELSVVKFYSNSFSSIQESELAKELANSNSVKELHFLNGFADLNFLRLILSAVNGKNSIVSLSIIIPDIFKYYEEWTSTFPLIIQQIKNLENLAHFKLTDLEFDENMIKTFIDSVVLMPNLTELTLDNAKIPNAFLPYLAKIIQSNITLKALNISNNYISQHNGVVSLAKALSQNNTLLSFNYSSRLEKALSKQHDVTAFLEAISLNNSLTTITLDGFRIEKEGTPLLAQWIKNNNTIKNLSLEACRIAVSIFLKAISHNSSLKSLSLEANPISESDEEVIAGEIKNNTSLTRLSLRTTNLSNRGISLISQALHDNHSIQILDLSNNNIGNEGIRAFARMLETNKTLTSVNLDLNPFDSVGAEFLFQALKKNKKLAVLQLPIKNITRDLRVSILSEIKLHIQLERAIQLAIVFAQAKGQNYILNESGTHENYFKSLPVQLLFLIFNIATKELDLSKTSLNKASIFNKVFTKINGDEKRDKKVAELEYESKKEINSNKKRNNVRTLFSQEVKMPQNNDSTEDIVLSPNLSTSN